MKVCVKLYGTLRNNYPDYQDSTGIELELSNEATAKELISKLNIMESQGAVVTMNSKILKHNDKIPGNILLDSAIPTGHYPGRQRIFSRIRPVESREWVEPTHLVHITRQLRIPEYRMEVP